MLPTNTLKTRANPKRKSPPATPPATFCGLTLANFPPLGLVRWAAAAAAAAGAVATAAATAAAAAPPAGTAAAGAGAGAADAAGAAGAAAAAPPATGSSRESSDGEEATFKVFLLGNQTSAVDSKRLNAGVASERHLEELTNTAKDLVEEKNLVAIVTLVALH